MRMKKETRGKMKDDEVAKTETGEITPLRRPANKDGYGRNKRKMANVANEDRE